MTKLAIKEIVALNGTIETTSGEWNRINYPSGYTRSNCFVVGYRLDTGTTQFSTQGELSIRLGGSNIAVIQSPYDSIDFSDKTYTIYLARF